MQINYIHYCSKVWGRYYLLMLLKEVSCVHQGHLFDQLKNVIHFKMLFIPLMVKLNFQQPLLQTSVSHDPSELILIC